MKYNIHIGRAGFKEGISLEFKKMHGLGNDFILVDGRKEVISNPREIAKKICDRHTGVGADGLIIVVHSERADIGMRIFNSDGSEAEMCGNGIRCFARFVFEERIIDSTEFAVETLAGIMKPVLILEHSGRVKSVVVDMGIPALTPGEVPVDYESGNFIDIPVQVEGECYRLSTIRMGVPHTVVFVDSLDSVDIAYLGKNIENLNFFPERTNVNFVQVEDRRKIKVRTWERGAGKTLACGTGCCASVVVSSILDKVDREVEVELSLGSMVVRWQEDGHVYMEGPAVNICKGIWLEDEK